MAKLTMEDIGTLCRAEDLQRRFSAGIFPRGAGQHAQYRKLERLGLLEFDGYGRDIDHEVEDDVRIYKLTEAGRLAIATPADPPGGGK